MLEYRNIFERQRIDRDLAMFISHPTASQYTVIPITDYEAE